jgi:hypothetical protein
VRTKAPGGLRRITHHLTLSQFPIAKTDFNIARAFLLGCFAGEDQRKATTPARDPSSGPPLVSRRRCSFAAVHSVANGTLRQFPALPKFERYWT